VRGRLRVHKTKSEDNAKTKQQSTMTMLTLTKKAAATTARRLPSASSLCKTFLRAKSTQVEANNKVETEGEGPIGSDGRHEIWREDIYDHDNEPR